MIITNSSCTEKRENKHSMKQSYCQYDFWKCSQIFPLGLKGFSRCDITALFLYYQQTKGALRTTWRLEWPAPAWVNWWLSPTTHEGGLRVAELKSTNCLQICSVKTGCSVCVWGGGALWSENSQLSLCQDCCLFAVLCYFPHVQLQLCIHLIPSYVRKHQQSSDSRRDPQEKFASNAWQRLYRF